MIRTTERSAVLREEFEKLGYTSEQLTIGDIECIRFTAPSGMAWLYKSSNGKLPLPYVGASFILNDKVLGAEYAESKGARVPRTVSVSRSPVTLAGYQEMLSAGQRAIVIKPSDATLSRGVSAHVASDEELGQAIVKARNVSRNVIAQERIEGNEYRFLYVGLELKAVILKQKLRVVGDGVTTIQGLLSRENEQRRTLEGLRVKYPQIALNSLGLRRGNLSRVPAEGEVVQLGDLITLEGGASFYEVKEEVHGSYVEIANRLAYDFGPGYLAVDIIMQNHRVAATTDNYAFLEFNDLPAPMYFYACRNQPEVPVMRDVVRLIGGGR